MARPLMAISSALGRRSVVTLFLLALLVSGIWTFFAAAIGATGRNFEQFMREWVLLQGTPVLLLGTFIVFLHLSHRLPRITRDLFGPKVAFPKLLPSWLHRLRIPLFLFISAIGTASLIQLGFNADGVGLIFLSISCFFVCLFAAVATLHALEILSIFRTLKHAKLDLFLYSPADTRGVRRITWYATFYGIVLTVGYALTMIATFAANWQAPSASVRMVQFFWPILYVPLCLAVLLYPHAVIHAVVRRQKDRLISELQASINEILSASDLTKEKVDRVNALADFIDRIEATPNYAVGIGVATGTVLPALFNVLTLIVPKPLIESLVGRVFGS